MYPLSDLLITPAFTHHPSRHHSSPLYYVLTKAIRIRTGPYITLEHLLTAFPSTKPPLPALLSNLNTLMPLSGGVKDPTRLAFEVPGADTCVGSWAEAVGGVVDSDCDFDETVVRGAREVGVVGEGVEAGHEGVEV